MTYRELENLNSYITSIKRTDVCPHPQMHIHAKSQPQTQMGNITLGFKNKRL